MRQKHTPAQTADQHDGGLKFEAYPQTAEAVVIYVKYSIATHTLSYYSTGMAKLTATRIDELTALIMDGHSLATACSKLKISRANVYTRMGKDKDIETKIRTAQRQSAEKSIEDLDKIYEDALHGRKQYDPLVLRDYGAHVRWKAGKLLPDLYGEQKNKAGVEIGDGTVRIVWET